MGKGLTHYVEIGFFVGIILMLGILMFRYFYFANPIVYAKEYVSKIMSPKKPTEPECSGDQIKIYTPDSHILCRVAYEDNLYTKIFDTYPKFSGEKYKLYNELEKGSVGDANLVLENTYKIDRYDPVKLENITWTEDPYKERYWRFNFYGLKPTNDLLYAFEKTGERKYVDKLVAIDESFFAKAGDKAHAWDDYHGSAYRNLLLIKTWWVLREHDLLTPQFSEELLRSIESHGTFLEDEKHYEPAHNHGITEAASLMLTANSFPDLNNSSSWRALSVKRLSVAVRDLIDADGVLVENSPYYHFYSLEKFWQIYKYTEKNHIVVTENLKEKIDKMVMYATYVLQPDSNIPILGSSLARNIKYSGNFKLIADEYPYFKYVLTHGQLGTKPPKVFVKNPTAGQVIMRSDWGGVFNFEKSNQLIFNVGPYRGKHSHLDALSFTLYGSGISMISDSGLYSYEKSESTSYYRGTSAHNTVVVDGKDQGIGDVVMGETVENSDYKAQSAEHQLYPGVQHKRSISQFGKDTFLIIDYLNSSTVHDYSQTFHLSPDIKKAQINGPILEANGSTGDQILKIQQLGVNGQMKISDSKCSYQYEKVTDCRTVTNEARGSDVRLYTLITIGKNDAQGKFEDNKIVLSRDSKKYTINVSETQNSLSTAYNVITETTDKKPFAEYTGGPAVVITFDDGASSLLRGAQVMSKYGMKGNIAVIGDRITNKVRGHLSVEELKELQSRGWSILNHSYNHLDALESYSKAGRYTDLENDIIMGENALLKNGIDTDPNWYIYPHGATDPQVAEVVNKYYKYARINSLDHERLNYSDDMALSALNVTISHSPEAVINKVAQARARNQIIFLTFHRIVDDNQPLSPWQVDYYRIGDFENLMSKLNDLAIPVKTVNQLDSENGTALNQKVIEKNIPGQLVLRIENNSFKYGLQNDKLKNMEVDTNYPAILENFVSKLTAMAPRNMLAKR